MEYWRTEVGKPNRDLHAILKSNYLVNDQNSRKDFEPIIRLFSAYIHSVNNEYLYLSTFLGRFTSAFLEFLDNFNKKEKQASDIIGTLERLFVENSIVKYIIDIDQTWKSEKPKKKHPPEDDPLDIRLINSKHFSILIECQIPGCLSLFKVFDKIRVDDDEDKEHLLSFIRLSILHLGKRGDTLESK